MAETQHLLEVQISQEEERRTHCGSFQEGDKDACVLYRSAASRKCPFVFFTLLLHFKWNLVNVSFQRSQFHHFHYTSCCHFNEASFFQRVWEQNLVNDLSEQTQFFKYFPELKTPTPQSTSFLKCPFANYCNPINRAFLYLKPEGAYGASQPVESMRNPGSQHWPAGYRGLGGRAAVPWEACVLHPCSPQLRGLGKDLE